MIAIFEAVKKSTQKPLVLTEIFLIVLALLAVTVQLNAEFFLNRVVGFLALGASFLILPLYLYKQQAFRYPFITNTLITTLITFLLVDETAPIWFFLLLGIVGFGIKHFVRVNRQPLFNPAAVTVLIAAVLGYHDSWWGVSFSPRFSELFISLAAFLTLPVGAYLAYKYKKLPISIALFVSLAITSFIFEGMVPLILLLEGTLFFFALIMATEPKTSPVQRNQQLVFGLAIGILTGVFIEIGTIATYPLALLIANVGYRIYQTWQMKQRSLPTPAPASQ